MVNRRVGELRREAGDRRPTFEFRYRPPPADFVKHQAERRAGRFDSIFKGNVDVLRVKEGENNIRILPGTWEGHDDYAYTVFFHRRVGADNSDYLCLRKMKGKYCPICAEAAAARKGGEEDEARALSWQEGKVVWVLDRNQDRPEPQIYRMPITLYRDINSLAYDKRTGGVTHIDNPDRGYDVRVRRQGTALNTRYLPSIEHTPSPIDERERTQARVLKYVTENPLPDFLDFKSAAYLEKVMSGTSDSRDDDLDDRRRRTRYEDDDEPVRRGRGRNGEDEDDDEPGDDEDEPEEEAPARRRRDQPEEEEERPTARSRRAERDREAEAEEEDREARSERRARTNRRGRDEEADEEDERPARTSSRARLRSRSADTEDEDEDARPARPVRSARKRLDDEDEADLPEDEEIAPKRRGRARRADPDEVEDEEPAPRRARARRVEDDPEIDEDERPARSRARTPGGSRPSRARSRDEDEDEEERRPRRR